MLPFAAQGAVMAIEDAYDLAAMVKSMPVGATLVRYEAMRRARVAKIRARGDFKPLRLSCAWSHQARARRRLCAEPGNETAAKLDWIYGYKAGE